jgi:predicted amino acid-binding ACT domain protein
MAVTVKTIKYWRGVVEHQPGVLAGVLAPIAASGQNLQVVMGYRLGEGKAAIELYPVTGRKVVAATQAAGFSIPAVPALLVQGDDKTGLGHAVAKGLSDAGINIAFMVVQVVGRRFSAVFGFDNEADTKKAAGLIKKAASPKKK